MPAGAAERLTAVAGGGAGGGGAEGCALEPCGLPDVAGTGKVRRVGAPGGNEVLLLGIR